MTGIAARSRSELSTGIIGSSEQVRPVGSSQCNVMLDSRGGHVSAHDEYALSIDLVTKVAEPLGEASLADFGLLERTNLQSWVESYPEMLGPDLIVITTELDQWELRDQKVSDRLDVLMLDASGHLLVAELKRGEATDTADLQALKYAAFCANLTVKDVIEEYARYRGIADEEALAAIVEHAPSLEENELGSVRVRLVASAFGASVSSVVLWLNELGLDIGCVQFTARLVAETRLVLSVRRVLPPPLAGDYLVRRRRREAVEEQREATKRRPQTVAFLNEHGAVAQGTVVTLRPEAFNEEQRPSVEGELAQDPASGRAIWTGKASRRALLWERDGEESSPSAIVWNLLQGLGFTPSGIHGPLYWQLPNGRSLWEEALALEEAPGADENPASPLTDDVSPSTPPSGPSATDGQLESPS